VTYFARSRRRGERALALAEFSEQPAQVAPGELPFERVRDLLVAFPEAEEPLFELTERGEVAGRERLALQDREVDLHLIAGDLEAAATLQQRLGAPARFARAWLVPRAAAAQNGEPGNQWLSAEPSMTAVAEQHGRVGPSLPGFPGVY